MSDFHSHRMEMISENYATKSIGRLSAESEGDIRPMYRRIWATRPWNASSLRKSKKASSHTLRRSVSDEAVSVCPALAEQEERVNFTSHSIKVSLSSSSV